MKLVFGDLDSKNQAEQAILDQRKFDAAVDKAFDLMRQFVTLPAPDAQIWDFPRHLRYLPIEALHEAANRIRKSRQASPDL